jgi:hypothetical protein
LKYVVKAKNRGGAPADPPAFPYDVAKDCLRLDLLRAGHCKPVGKPVAFPVPNNLQTYAIAMTDWHNYWRGSKPKGGWATNFYNAMRATPVRFEGLIKTTGRDSNNTIALGRCHIAFGRSWTGEWRPYGSTKQA